MDPILEALFQTNQPHPKKQKQIKIIEPQEEKEEYVPNLQERKIKQEIRKLEIDNEIKLRNLVDRKLVQSILAEVGHAIQTNLVDRGRREAPVMSAKLGIPQLERDLEMMLNKQDEKSIESIIGVIENLCNDDVFL